MIAVMAVAAISANAQYYVGGSLGYNSTKAKTEIAGQSADNTVSAFSIAPEFGYNLDDNLAVGIKLGYANADGKKNTWSINPYLRYTYAKAGNFSAFVDGGIAYQTEHVNGEKNWGNTNTFGIAINPGFSYAVSEKVSLVAHIGDLSYAFGSKKSKDVTPEVKVSSSIFNLSLDNAISFGAYYNF